MTIKCPNCKSHLTYFRKKTQKFFCYDCRYEWTKEEIREEKKVMKEALKNAIEEVNLNG